MNRFANKIKICIEESDNIVNILNMTEKELKEHLEELKKQIFSDKIGKIS